MSLFFNVIKYGIEKNVLVYFHTICKFDTDQFAGIRVLKSNQQVKNKKLYLFKTSIIANDLFKNTVMSCAFLYLAAQLHFFIQNKVSEKQI